eukprot:4742803-Pyramimonas_sp.AAC.1
MRRERASMLGCNEDAPRRPREEPPEIATMAKDPTMRHSAGLLNRRPKRVRDVSKPALTSIPPACSNV